MCWCWCWWNDCAQSMEKSKKENCFVRFLLKLYYIKAIQKPENTRYVRKYTEK